MKKLLLAPALAVGLLAAAPAANAAGISFGIHVGDHHHWRRDYWHARYHHRYCRSWGWHHHCRYWSW